MKKSSLLLVLAAFLAGGIAIPAFAGEKEMTVTGEGKCAKCSLHESDKCQNTVTTMENGKSVTYYLTQNKVSKEFHENICKEPQKITVTGTVKEEHGKKMLAASKIELAK